MHLKVVQFGIQLVFYRPKIPWCWRQFAQKTTPCKHQFFESYWYLPLKEWHSCKRKIPPKRYLNEAFLLLHTLCAKTMYQRAKDLHSNLKIPPIIFKSVLSPSFWLTNKNHHSQLQNFKLKWAQKTSMFQQGRGMNWTVEQHFIISILFCHHLSTITRAHFQQDHINYYHLIPVIIELHTC